jgi:hypothetical protein
MERRMRHIKKTRKTIKRAVKAKKITKAIKDKNRVVANLKKIPKKKSPNISDHAVLRYLERYYDIDVQAIRDEMYTPDVEYALNNGARSVPIGDMVFKIVNKTIATVYKK